MARAPFARGRRGRALPETGQATSGSGASELRQEPVVDGFSRRGEFILLIQQLNSLKMFLSLELFYLNQIQ